MTIIGFSFRLTDLETGRIVGHAVLCPEAQYAGRLNHSATLLDRHSLTPFQWLLIGQQLNRRLDSGPLHRSSAIVALLLDADRRADIAVQHIVSTPLDASADEATAALDAHLLEFAATTPSAVNLSQLE